MAALLQRGQVVRIIPALPTIKRLTTDAEVTAGTSHVATATKEIHPGQTNRASRLNSTPVLASRPDPGGVPSRICILTLYSSVTNHSGREQRLENSTWHLAFSSSAFG